MALRMNSETIGFVRQTVSIVSHEALRLTWAARGHREAGWIYTRQGREVNAAVASGRLFGAVHDQRMTHHMLFSMGTGYHQIGIRRVCEGDRRDAEKRGKGGICLEDQGHLYRTSFPHGHRLYGSAGAGGLQPGPEHPERDGSAEEGRFGGRAGEGF